MTEPSREDLEALLHLQQAETSIRRLERRLQDLPEQAALDASLELSARVKADQDVVRVELERTEGQARKLEGELELLQQRRDHERERLYGGSIDNPRELQALRAELENVAQRITALEDRLLEVMEEREELAGAVAALERRREELASEQEELTARRDESAKELLAELAETRVARDADASRVPDDVQASFEAAKDRHGGVGVGLLDGRICTACHMELTPLERSNLGVEDRLARCPQCQRLLVVLAS